MLAVKTEASLSLTRRVTNRLWSEAISMDKKDSTKFSKRTIGDWLKILVLLLDEAAVLVLVIVVLRFFGIRIPWPIMIVIVLLLGTFVFITHKAVIPTFRWRPVSGSEGMIGAQGIVVVPLTPVGTITVQGEHWRAVSVDDNIEVDETVEIIGLDRLTLKVKRQDDS